MLALQPLALQIVDQGRDAAGQGITVGTHVVGLRGLQLVDELAARPRGTIVQVSGIELVIAQQGDLRATDRNGGHAVGLVGHEEPVIHRLTGVGDHPV